MRKWYAMDDCTSKRAELFQEELDAMVKDDAIEEGAEIFFRLTEHDQKDRDAFWVASYDVDEDGDVDFETEEDMVDIKAEYRVLPEYHDLWTSEYLPDGLIVKMDEIVRLAHEWERPVTELLDQVETI